MKSPTPARRSGERNANRQAATAGARLGLACGFCSLLLWLVPLGLAAEPESPPPQATLHLSGGDFLAGQLLAGEDAQQLTWQSDAFASPLRFPLAAVQAIHFPRQDAPRAAAGAFCFELGGGDLVYGSLVSLDAGQAVIEAAGLGRLKLDRTALRRLSRASPEDVIYSGPAGIEGWEISPPKAWRAEADQALTDQVEATLRRPLALPPLARYEVELSWKTQPRFELVMGGTNDPATSRPVFRLETWESDLVIVRESGRQADLASVHKLAADAGRVHLQIFVDQQQGRVLVFSPGGDKLAELNVPEDKSPLPAIPEGNAVLPQLIQNIARQIVSNSTRNVSLVNHRGDLKLERLSVTRWSGNPPAAEASGADWLRQSTGQAGRISVLSFDSPAKQLVIERGGNEERVAETAVQDLVFAQPADEEPRPVKLLLASGIRLSGNLAQVASTAITLSCPGIHTPLVVPLADLQSLVVNHETATLASKQWPAGTREGRLEMPGLSLRGGLASAPPTGEERLVFQPVHGENASPLAVSASGRLVYREPQTPKPETPQPLSGAPVVRPVPGRVLNGVRTLLGTRYTPAARPAPPGDCMLHLRTGDTLPCRAPKIDEDGVWIKSAVTDAEFIPHARIKALELRTDVPPVKIEKTKAERLLTLPRMQRDNPPEQLIRSLEGDYLRGRLVAMDDKELQLELRLETRSVERAQVARIIWLHPDELTAADRPAPPPAAAAHPPAGILVQAVQRSGQRMTFVAQQVEGSQLSGQSDVLGVCRANLDQIDQLLIGGSIADAAEKLAFHQWKLKPAAEPLPVPEEGAEPGSNEGLESVLVGKPAPGIDLELLDGSKFRLADHKNKIILLDFWASWCGPCLQSMPLVDRVASEFKDQVYFVAINQQESPERIRQALERLKLSMPVALDHDGRAAERYGATAIPQTVIIDRAGKVARLFIGTSARFDEQLRQALQGLLERPSGAAGP